MDKITKRLVVVLIILIILLVGYVGYIWYKNKGNAKKESESTEQNTIAIDQENNDEENEITENATNTGIVENAISKNELKRNTSVKKEESSNTKVVGKEEAESNKENGGVNPQEIAINLAKEEWGETSKNYEFTVDQIEGDIYHIAVNSNAQVIGYVDVNIKTKTATER